MKAECSKEKLKDGLLVADRITGKNLSLPILSYIYLHAIKNKIIIRSTNLDIGVEIVIPAKVIHDGIVVVPGSLIISILSNSPHEMVTLEEVNGNVTITTPNLNTIIKSIPCDDYPNLPKNDTGEKFTINTSCITSGIQSVVFSAALSDIKPEISSVYIYSNNSDLIFVSTDGFRLAEKKFPLKLNNEFKAIIPYKNALEIARILDGNDNESVIFLSPSLISIQNGVYTITSRLIDGVYPDYPQLIPSSFSTTSRVSRQDLVNTLRLAHIFCDRTNQIQLTLQVADSVFMIHSQNTEKGEYSSSIQTILDGEDLQMNINVRYLVDVLPLFHRPTVFIGCNGRGKPLLSRDDGDNSFLYIVMPMNR